MKDSSYWPDRTDPLGRIHCKEKNEALDLKLIAGMYFTLIRDFPDVAECMNSNMTTQSGDKWWFAKCEWSRCLQKAVLDFDQLKALDQKAAA